MVKKVYAKEPCMMCGKPAPCACPSVSKKKRLVRYIKGRPTESTEEVPDGSQKA